MKLARSSLSCIHPSSLPVAVASELFRRFYYNFRWCYYDIQWPIRDTQPPDPPTASEKLPRFRQPVLEYGNPRRADQDVRESMELT